MQIGQLSAIEALFTKKRALNRNFELLEASNQKIAFHKMSLKFFSHEDRVLKYVNRPTGAQYRPYY